VFDPFADDSARRECTQAPLDGTQQVPASRPLPAMGAEFAPGLPSIQSNSRCVIVLCQHRDVLLRGDMQRMVWEWLRRFRQPRWTTI
jgi:hypothetical protein